MAPDYSPYGLSHIETLAAESIFVIREVAAEFDNPALLFSGGKDSAVLLHLALKAFLPGPLPFRICHIDTGHNFPEVIEYRDRRVRELGLELIVSSVADLIEAGRLLAPDPLSSRNRLQTAALLDVIRRRGYDALLGGARRDEERSRAKERVFSLRDEAGQWEPRHQRPELWSLYNGRHRRGEHFRVFPLSNWTEIDIWQYLAQERIPLPSLYFAHRRAVVERDGLLLGVGPFLSARPDEEVVERLVRYRTVGDMTCTAAVASTAASYDDVLAETAAARITERGATRVDDRAGAAAMEDRKREGYF